jgi:hypothetical protein
MERYCGIVKPIMARQLSESLLTNAVINSELLNHIRLHCCLVSNEDGEENDLVIHHGRFAISFRCDEPYSPFAAAPC